MEAGRGRDLALQVLGRGQGRPRMVEEDHGLQRGEEEGGRQGEEDHGQGEEDHGRVEADRGQDIPWFC